MRYVGAEWRPVRSRLRLAGLLGSGIAVLGALYYTGIEALWQWAVVGLLLAWYVYDSVRAWRSPIEAFAQYDGKWHVVIAGQPVPARLRRHHFFGRRLGVIHFDLGAGRCYSVALLPDSLDSEAFRRLRVALG